MNPKVDLRGKLQALRGDAFQLAKEFAGRDATCTVRADDGEKICSMIHDLAQGLLEITLRMGIT